MQTHRLHSFVLLLLVVLQQSSASVYDEINCDDGTCVCSISPDIVVNCPDFCGPGRDLSYSYSLAFLTDGTSPTTRSFEVKGCVDIEDVNDVLGQEWSVFDYSPTAPAPETGWTCSDFCLSEANAPIDGTALPTTVAPSAAPSFFPTSKHSMAPSATPTVSPSKSKPPLTVVIAEDTDSDTSPNSSATGAEEEAEDDIAEDSTLSISNEVDTNNANRALLGSYVICASLVLFAL